MLNTVRGAIGQGFEVVVLGDGARGDAEMRSRGVLLDDRRTVRHRPP